MKMKSISTLLVKGILLISFIYAGSISPTLALRFNDVSGTTNLVEPVQCIGLKLGVGEGVYSGIETDGTDFRLYIQRSFGTFSMGRDAAGDPQFSIGGNYNILDNFNVSFDYIINQLTPDSDKLRLSIVASF